MHKTDKQAKTNLSEERSLERRLLRQDKGADNNDSCLVANAEEFKHILLKYCLKKQRIGRDFALSAFSILEYQSLLNNFGQVAADQLLHMVQAIVISNIRDSDRLCYLSNGSFLLLLPDSAGNDALQAGDRLSRSVAGGKTQYHKHSLHASLLLKVVATDGGSIDAQALLNEIGYEIAGDGKLCQVENLAGRNASLISSDLSSWLGRYQDIELIDEVCLKTIKLRKFAALDTWQKDSPVQLLLIETTKDILESSVWELFCSRARILQSIDHPCVLAIDDYYGSVNGGLAFSYQLPGDKRLAEYLHNENSNQSSVYFWIEQILNIFIYLQSVIPPVVPNKIKLDNFSVSYARQLMLVDYFLPYLLPGVDLSANHLGNCHLPGNNGTVFIESFLSLLKDLVLFNPNLADKQILSSLPKSLNTLYKIRLRLQEILPQEILPDA